MAKVFLNLEDMDNGSGAIVACQECYVGGFDNQSHAHQTAKLLIHIMDALLSRQGDPLEILETVPIADLAAEGKILAKSLRYDEDQDLAPLVGAGVPIPNHLKGEA